MTDFSTEPTNTSCCGICYKKVNRTQRAFTCSQCNNMLHAKCNSTPTSTYEQGNICITCIILDNSKMFPFTLENDDVLQGINSIDLPSLADSLPSLDISSKLTNLPNLSNYDIDENLYLNINSQYCTIEELSNQQVSQEDLSLFHMNIRSLSLHHDEFHSLLTNLNTNFKVIGLSEIKASVDTPISDNIELPGYKFHYTPSNSAAGGVGIYVKSDLRANKRDDLSFTNDDFETIWIEIDNSKAKNILCCCAYRHPSSDISVFSDHFQETFSKLENENKLIFVMGDFNINLLNHENHTPTNEFINMMFSNNLQPSVLHPTRISDTCSTLIDNIFVNSAPDSKIHSGNVLSLISDHLPQFCIIYDCKFDYKASSYLSYDYSQFDANKFLADYAEIDTSFLADQNINLDGKF